MLSSNIVSEPSELVYYLTFKHFGRQFYDQNLPIITLIDLVFVSLFEIGEL